MPELAIGRLPVQTASDAAALIAKIVAYDAAGAAAWKAKALLVAGTNDAENDFEAQVAAVAAGLPEAMTVTTVKHGSTPAPAETFLTAFNSGQGLGELQRARVDGNVAGGHVHIGGGRWGDQRGGDAVRGGDDVFERDVP